MNTTAYKPMDLPGGLMSARSSRHSQVGHLVHALPAGTSDFNTSTAAFCGYKPRRGSTFGWQGLPHSTPITCAKCAEALAAGGVK